MHATQPAALHRVPIPTAEGEFIALFTERGLAALFFPGQDPALIAAWAARHVAGATLSQRESHAADLLRLELEGYFEGRVTRFTVPLDLRGTTFQIRVWEAVSKVEYGRLSTYGIIAREIGAPSAVRAVGAANGANPVPVIVPCHRIVGSDGRLVGYGGGLHFKRRLLELEGVLHF